MYKDLLQILFSARVIYGNLEKDKGEKIENLFYAFDSGTATNEDRLIALLLLVDLENETTLVDNAVPLKQEVKYPTVSIS